MVAYSTPAEPAVPLRPALRIHLASLAPDLSGHRQKLVAAVEKVPQSHLRIEVVEATNATGLAESCRLAAEADALIVCVAIAYTRIPRRSEGGDGKTSLAWHEVSAASAAAKPVFVFLLDLKSAWPPVEARLTQVRGFAQRSALRRASRGAAKFRHFLKGLPRSYEFEDPDDLAFKISDRLTRWISRLESQYQVEYPRGGDSPPQTIAGVRLEGRPPVTRTSHTLPFEKLSPHDFERFCFWLLIREGFEDVEYIGETGSDGGCDLLAYRGGERYIFQCKRVHRLSPTLAAQEVSRILALPEHELPHRLVFLVTTSVSLRARRKARETWGPAETCHFWCGSELDERAKRHPDILQEFFSLAVAGLSVPYAHRRPRLKEVDPLARSPSETEQIATELAEAYRLEAALLAKGEDATSVRQRVLTLRRRLRDSPILRPGMTLLEGRIRLIEWCGSGGFGTVWKAFDSLEQTLIAVKVLHQEYVHDRQRLERFFRGARRVAALRHENIIRVTIPHGEDRGHHFIAMEYMPNGDFRTAVLSGRLSVTRRLEILLDACAGLAYAHSKSLIHRDIKPDNILLDSNDQPKLADFDLVRAPDTTGGTQAGMLGTVLYSAPEAMLDASGVEVAADIYSMGMTFLFALHGKDLPLEVLRETEPFVSSLDAPPSMKSALLGCLEWKKERRWQSISNFARAARHCLSAPPAEVGEEPTLSASTPVERPPSSSGGGRTIPFRRPAVRHGRRGYLVPAIRLLVQGTGLAALGVAAVLATAQFRLERVSVPKGRRVDSSFVKRTVEQYIGTPLLALPHERLVSELEQNPWVASVSMRAELPRTLVVSLEERMEYAIAELNGAFHYLDMEGNLLGATDRPAYVLELPVITGGRDPDAYKGAVEVIRELRELGVDWAVGKIRVTVVGGDTYLVESEELPCPFLLSPGSFRARMPYLDSLFAAVPWVCKGRILDLRIRGRLILLGGG